MRCTSLNKPTNEACFGRGQPPANTAAEYRTSSLFPLLFHATFKPVKALSRVPEPMDQALPA